jgi:hypothetical protein
MVGSMLLIMLALHKFMDPSVMQEIQQQQGETEAPIEWTTTPLAIKGK